MAFRGRGRGRGGRGRGGGGGFLERSSKKEPYILFPEDVILPSLPNIDNLTNEEKLLIRSKYKLEHFWLVSCYHLELEAFPKSEKSKRDKEKSSKVLESKKEDVEIERYSDRFKQRTLAKREALESYLKQIPSNFPPELIQGAKRARRATKKLRWDRNLDEQKLDVFAKLEEKHKGNDEEDEGEDEVESEEGGEYSDEGDYEQNRDFDDDDDDMNQDDGPEEDKDVYE